MDYVEPQDYDFDYMQLALNEAQLGLAEGGLPIGSVLVAGGQIVGRGHDRTVQMGNPVLHSEIDTLQNTKRLQASKIASAVLYTTRPPSAISAGMIIELNLPRVVMAHCHTAWAYSEWFVNTEIELVNLDMTFAKEMVIGLAA